jgi:hypothetical protein
MGAGICWMQTIAHLKLMAAAGFVQRRLPVATFVSKFRENLGFFTVVISTLLNELIYLTERFLTGWK